FSCARAPSRIYPLPLHDALPIFIPRGRSLGMVMQLPEGDRYSMSYKYMVSRLAIMMGGRVAEETKFGKENITSGAASDIDQATKDRKSTRLNSSHVKISYAVFCL